MLIDFHTHAFPDRIASRAIAALSYSAGGMIPQSGGTVESLLTQMDLDGVDIAVVQSIATNPTQQHSVNRFATEINQHPRIVAFGSVHPEAEDALEELEHIADAGLKGVKFHSEYQQFYADDEKMKPIYRKISELGLITLFHGGHDIGMSPPYHCEPVHLLRAMKWLDGPVVSAHWGGFCCWSQVLDTLCGENLYFDISMGYGAIPKPIAQEIVEKHGPDKLLFASDMPWHRPAWEKRMLESLDLSPEDREKIYFRNAAKLLNLE